MGKCRALTNDEVGQLLSAIEGRNAARDRAWICVGLYLGFRIAEILSLRIGSVLDDGQLRTHVRVGAKNMKGQGQPRAIRMDHPVLCQAMQAWLAELAERGWRERSAYLFQSRKAGPPPEGKAISTRTADRILATLKRRAGLRGVVASHSLRKTAARCALEIITNSPDAYVRTRAVVYLQHWLGHASLRSTQYYIDTERDILDEVGRQFPVPNVRVPNE